MRRRGVIGIGAQKGAATGTYPYQNSQLTSRHSGMVTHDERNLQISQLSSGKGFSQVKYFEVNQNLSTVGMSKDGRHLYLGSAYTRNVYYYKLHTPFDINDRTYVGAKYNVDWHGIHSFEVDENGEYFYITDYNDRLHTYQMLDPYNITGTIREAGRSGVDLHSTGAPYDDNPTGVAMKPDGTKIYTIGYRNDRVAEFNLSTPFDVSTASLNGNFDVGNEIYTPFGLYFKPDGTAFWVMDRGRTPKTMYKYSLSTAWDVTTASYDTDWGISPDSNTTYSYYCFMFNNDGTKFHLAGDNGRIYRYDVGTAWDLTSTLTNGGFMSWYIDYQDDIYGMAFNSDGTQLIALSSASTDLLVVKELSTPYDTTTATTATGTEGYAVMNEDMNRIYYPRGLAVGGTNATSHVIMIQDDNGSRNVTMYNLQTPNKLDSIRLPSTYVDRLQGGNDLPTQSKFRYDGKVIYVFDESDEQIYQYNLKYPFVLNHICMSSGGVSVQLDDSSQDYNGMAWSNDGRFVFLASNGYDRIYTFELVTPWDITGGFVTSGGGGYNTNDRAGCEFGRYESQPKDMIMGGNGTSLIIVGETNDDLVELTLNF